jgi:hypothetical protein
VNCSGEWEQVGAVKDAILVGLFTDGKDLPWDESIMFDFNSGEDSLDVDIPEFLQKKRMSDNWASFQVFTMAEKEMIAGLLFGTSGPDEWSKIM